MNHFKLVCYQSIYNQLDVDNRGYVAIPYGNNQWGFFDCWAFLSFFFEDFLNGIIILEEKGNLWDLCELLIKNV
jgi:hypothetical protein